MECQNCLGARVCPECNGEESIDCSVCDNTGDCQFCEGSGEEPGRYCFDCSYFEKAPNAIPMHYGKCKAPLPLALPEPIRRSSPLIRGDDSAEECPCYTTTEVILDLTPAVTATPASDAAGAPNGDDSKALSLLRPQDFI